MNTSFESFASFEEGPDNIDSKNDLLPADNRYDSTTAGVTSSDFNDSKFLNLVSNELTALQ